MPYLIEDAERFGMRSFSPTVKANLIRMSPATIGRRIHEHRARNPRHYPPIRRRRSTPDGLESQIDVRRWNEWAGEPPGSLQADLVYHSGRVAGGRHLYAVLPDSAPISCCRATPAPTRRRSGSMTQAHHCACAPYAA